MSTNFIVGGSLPDNASKSDFYKLVTDATPKPALIEALDPKATPTSADKVMIFDAAAGALKYSYVHRLPTDPAMNYQVSNLTVNQNLTVLYTLTVGGAVTFNGTFSPAGIANRGDITATKDITAGGDIAATGGVTSGGTLVASAGATVAEDLAAGGNITASGYIESSGGITGVDLTASGAVSVGTTLGVTGMASLNGGVKLPVTGTTPTTGTAGEIRIMAGYIYVCVATDTWKKVAIAS